MHSQPSSTRHIIIETVKTKIRNGDHLSMSSIAQDAEVSKSSLYYFFEDKNDLLATVVESLFDECKLNSKNILDEPLPADEKLGIFISMMASMAQKESAITHFVFQELFRKNMHLLRRLYERRETKKKLLISLLQEGQASAIFRTFDTEKTAEILLGMIDFFILTGAFPGSPSVAPDQIIPHLITLLRP